MNLSLSVHRNGNRRRLQASGNNWIQKDACFRNSLRHNELGYLDTETAIFLRVPFEPCIVQARPSEGRVARSLPAPPLLPGLSAEIGENYISSLKGVVRMWNTRSVQLNVRLPNDLAAEAEEVQLSDPDFLSRVVQYGLTRRSIYRRLREAEGSRGSPASHSADASTGFAHP